MLIRVFSLVLALRLSGPGLAAESQPLTLQAALDEAQLHHPELIALRAQIEADKLKPGQERFLMPPMVDAQIWQWPLNRVDPRGTT